MSASLPLGNLDTAAVAASPYPDNGTENWESYATEAYAQVFAFAPLVDPDSSARLAHARRARNVFMYIIRQAALGQQANTPFRSKMFSTYNRANYWGEDWGLIFDWLQASPVLSSYDKQLTRTTFLRWVQECLVAYTAGDEHPHPVGVVNDPQLLSDKKQLRWAANNYFTGHMRNSALMALSIDSVDDPL